MGAPVILMGATHTANPTRTPVLLELFTSEGCSSCPPADALLDQLDRTQPFPNVDLIVLSEHVDYWDQLGWKDPYSSAMFSTRQNQYATHFRMQEVYTPQIVIDGGWQGVGSDRNQIRREVEKAAAKPKLPITLEASHNAHGGALKVGLTPSAATPAAMFTSCSLRIASHRMSSTARMRIALSTHLSGLPDFKHWPPAIRRLF